MSQGNSSHTTADAWLWLEHALGGRPVPPTLVMIGLGDGEILNALDRRAPHTRVLAIEPNAASCARLAAAPQAVAWQRSGRLVYLVDPDYVGAEEAWRLFPPADDQPMVVVHPGLVRCDGLPRAKETLKRILFGVRANAAARRRFAPRYLTNSIRNIPQMLGGTDVRALTDKYQGVPAVIAGAGPSLDAAIAPLQRLSGRALVIATDTALRPLLTAGIAPPLVVGMDPGSANVRHFLGLPECKNTWLASESALDPDAASVFADRTFWFRLADHQPWPWLNSIGIDVGAIDVWGSVLTGAFQIACLAGCNPIVIVGADLAYTGGQPYARGTTSEFDWAWYAGYGRILPGAWELQRSGVTMREAADLRGAATETTEILQSFRDWMVARARRCGRRVINATGAGILFGEGIEQMTLEQALKGRGQVPPVGAFARPTLDRQRGEMATQLRHIRQALENGSHATRPLPEWAEFGGEGLDPASLSSALDRAVTSLTGAEQKAKASPPSWAELISRQMSDDRLRDLPEATLRLRAGLNGDTLSVAAACADAGVRIRVLTKALVELETLCSLILEGDEPQPIVNLALYGQVPVALMYAWPEPQRWAVQAFEALLGPAWPATPLDGSTPGVSTPAPAVTGRRDSQPTDGAVPRRHAAAACQQLASEWQRCTAEVRSSGTALADEFRRFDTLLDTIDDAR